MVGGSELRAITLNNAIIEHTPHESFLFAERNIPERLEKLLDPKVKLYKNLFAPNEEAIEALYGLDCLLIVNSDMKSACLSDYWRGLSEQHSTEIDLRRIKQMVFLFNFLVSPARHLYTIERYCKNIKIITTNRKFFDEITSQDRYELARHFPRMILESPINPNLYTTEKTESTAIRIGCHSKTPDFKWNEDWPKLIVKCKERLKDKIEFDFMGMSSKRAAEVKKTGIPLIIRKENEISVKEFLTGIDIFTFYPSASREEPWARCNGEAMASACPILTIPKGGNLDQVINGNNGYLCKKTDDFFKRIVELVEHPEKIKMMAENSLRLSRNFTSEKVINRFLEFINA